MSDILKKVDLIIARSFLIQPLYAAGDVSSYYTIPVIRESFNFHSKLDTGKAYWEWKAVALLEMYDEMYDEKQSFELKLIKQAGVLWLISPSQYNRNE